MRRSDEFGPKVLARFYGPAHRLPVSQCRLFLCAGGGLLSLLLLGGCTGPGVSSPEAAQTSASGRVYHVHLRLTEKKDRAVSVLGQALRWWNEMPAAQRPPLAEGAGASGRPVTIEWKPPFYRVRLGPFATEQRAETAAQTAAASTFPDAFVAPGRPAPSVRRRGPRQRRGPE